MVFPMDTKRGSDYRLTLSAAFRSYHKYSNIQRKEKAWVLQEAPLTASAVHIIRGQYNENPGARLPVF